MLGVHAMMIRANHMTHPIADALDKAAAALRALLDAKEAAETQQQQLVDALDVTEDALTEARASVAAAWEVIAIAGQLIEEEGKQEAAGWDAVYSACLEADPSATEALRRVKEKVFDEAIATAGATFGAHTLLIAAIANPYAAKEAAHG